MNARKRIARCTIVALVGSVALLVHDAAAGAQAARTVREGERVRVHYAMHGSAVGQLTRADADSVTVLAEGGNRVTIPAASITQIDRSAGTKTHTLAGALIGGGLCTALILVADDASNDQPLAVDDEGLETAAAVVVIGLGTLAGAFIGHLAKSEQWEPATVPGATIGLSATRGAGVGLALNVSF